MNIRNKILVTGSNGVLGTAILKQLNLRGYKNVLSPSRFEMDLLNVESTISYFEINKPDIVIHLASLVYGLLGNMNNQLRSLIGNTNINNNIFEAISKTNVVTKMFFAGTVAGYPYPYANDLLKECDFFGHGLPHDGEFGYAMSKRHAYAYLKILSEESDIKFTYGVFTNLYGINDKFDVINGHVIPSLISKAYTAKTTDGVLDVWGDGSGIRDFLYADDAADATLLCLEAGCENEIINISSGMGTPLSEVANIVANNFGVKKINFSMHKPTGILRRTVDNTKLKSIGFSQKFSIQNGLKITSDWYSNNIDKVRI